MGRPIYSHKKSDFEEIESSESIHVIHSDRSIFLSGGVEEQPISTAIVALLQMTKKDPTKQINLMISTFGGSVVDMFGLYDTIKYVQSRGCPVATIGLGKIMSAGVPLLACGNKGLRFIGEHATVMIHPAYDDSSSGDYFQMKNNTDEMKRLQDMMDNVLLKHTKMTKEELSKIITSRLDTYISSEQAIKLGIVDKLIGED